MLLGSYHYFCCLFRGLLTKSFLWQLFKFPLRIVSLGLAEAMLRFRQPLFSYGQIAASVSVSGSFEELYKKTVRLAKCFALRQRTIPRDAKRKLFLQLRIATAESKEWQLYFSVRISALAGVFQA